MDMFEVNEKNKDSQQRTRKYKDEANGNLITKKYNNKKIKITLDV